MESGGTCTVPHEIRCRNSWLDYHSKRFLIMTHIRSLTKQKLSASLCDNLFSLISSDTNILCLFASSIVRFASQGSFTFLSIDFEVKSRRP